MRPGGPLFPPDFRTTAAPIPEELLPGHERQHRQRGLAEEGAEQAVQGEREQERRELAERQDLERRRRDAEGFERSLRKKLSVGDLLTMLKEGRSYSDETIL